MKTTRINRFDGNGWVPLETPAAVGPISTRPADDPSPPGADLRSEWDRSASIRAYFRGDFETFAAFKRTGVPLPLAALSTPAPAVAAAAPLDLRAVQRVAGEAWDSDPDLQARHRNRAGYAAMMAREVEMSLEGKGAADEQAAWLASCRAEWNGNAALRKRFADSFESFEAYQRHAAAGHVKIGKSNARTFGGGKPAA